MHFWYNKFFKHDNLYLQTTPPTPQSHAGRDTTVHCSLPPQRNSPALPGRTRTEQTCMRPPSATPVLRDPTVKVKLDRGRILKWMRLWSKYSLLILYYQYLYIYVTSYIICILNYNASIRVWLVFVCRVSVHEWKFKEFVRINVIN